MGTPMTVREHIQLTQIKLAKFERMHLMRQLGASSLKIAEACGGHQSTITKRLADRAELIVKLDSLQSVAAKNDLKWPYEDIAM